MDLNQLEYFLRVAELGSINRAAKELGLSQPALSRSLSQLEHDLGQQLVVRCRTGITITEAGSILASRGLALLREAGAIREELANDPAGRVVVGMPAALRHLVTLPALQMMRSTSPGTAVRVHEGFNVFLRDMLKHGLLDIAVIAMEQVSDASIAPEMLVREPLVLVRSAKLAAPHDPARIEDVVEFPLALPGRPNAVRGIVDRAIRECRLTAEGSARAREPGALSGIRPMRAGRTDGDAEIRARGKGHRRHARSSHRRARASLGVCACIASDSTWRRSAGSRASSIAPSRMPSAAERGRAHPLSNDAPSLHRNSKNGSMMFGESASRARNSNSCQVLYVGHARRAGSDDFSCMFGDPDFRIECPPDAGSPSH